MLRGFLLYMDLCRLLGVEDYDTVPVVFGIRLCRAAFALDGKTVGIDAVLIGEGIGDSLCATLRQLLVVCCGAGVLVGIAYYCY